ncbi:trichohyalin [Angomonas deanei]|uniref:Uncharacterized protein n=1 Tax=Angomonas deanei TaxID=59799 RepID=A0A7G2CGD9_9TRYP|nr:trichohyalin [Angomonas deanei]CAD2218425.1 hypothetical protein, conserved [Angomonas deanei]|eukprot:EPY37734.1 trichohyalin [Angomonas deanei]
MYQQLIDQSNRMEESQRTALLRSNVERIHEAQVRFKASLELEDERERLVEAHQHMEEERRRVAKETRTALLQEAAELRAKGATSEEVQQYLRQRQLEKHAERQAEYQLREQQSVLQSKNQYLSMIDQLKGDFERRDGLELMQQTEKENRRVNAFGFMDEDVLETGNQLTPSSAAPPTAKFQQREDHQPQQAPKPDHAPSPYEESKEELWRRISQDKYEDPFLTVHQARLDAVKYYDTAYARTVPLEMKQGRKYASQGMGQHAVGGGTENQIYKGGNDLAHALQWGTNAQVVHDIDGDGSKGYFMDNLWHVRDKETGDIDWRYEKKVGGPILRGPAFYRMGAAREAAEPGEQPMEPTPDIIRRRRENTQRRGQSGMRVRKPWKSR